MTVIDTTTASAGLGFCNGRHIDRTSTGRVWMGFQNGSNQIEFWYSDDEGSTWTQNTSATLSANLTAGFSFFIDIDDHAHIAYNPSGSLHYRRMANISSTSSWGSTFSVDSSYEIGPDIVAFREGASWIAAITSTNGTSARVFILKSVDTSPTKTTYSLGTGINVSIDFRHTGDGKTVAGGEPHVYVVGSYPADLYIRRFTYSGGTYTMGSATTMDGITAKRDAVSSAFDGSRMVTAYAESDIVYIAERDAADTTTTLITPTALSDGAVTNVSVTYDANENIHLWAVGTTSDDLKRIKYTRSAGTWDGSWTTVLTGTVYLDSLTLKRGYSDSTIEAVFLDGASSPYDVVYESFSLNVAPTAPTWDAPADNSYNDIASALVLDWTFTDPDAGDTQSAYALSKSVDGGALSYWNAGTSAWGATEVENPTATTSVTLASSWASDGESIEYKVKTWDAAAVEGIYGLGLTVNAAAATPPTITAPATSATITGSSADVSWTVAAQAAYQVRVLSSVDAELYSTGKVTGAVTEVTLGYVFTDGQTGLKIEVTTWNASDVPGVDTNTGIDVSFTPPATPVLTVTANTAGYLSVAIADPTPTGGQPTVETHDIFVRVAAGGRQSGERTVNDDGIRISTGVVVTNGTYLDYAAATGTDFEYRTLAVAGTATTYSAWT